MIELNAKICIVILLIAFCIGAIQIIRRTRQDAADDSSSVTLKKELTMAGIPEEKCH